MNKVVFGLILGGILGVFDGLSALLSAPETAPGIVGIVIGSTVKGLIAGAVIGWFARKVHSLPLGLLFGLVVGALLAGVIVWLGGQYFWEIMIPGSIVGLIVGYATQRHGEGAAARPSGAAAGILLLAAGLAATPAAAADHGAGHASLDAPAAFERLKGLAGRWEGTAAGEPGGVVEYRVGSGGSIVVETMFVGTPHEMMSVYHLDGDDLVMVHYCSGGNQPKMRLVRAGADELVFDYSGGSNLDPARDAHIHGARHRFLADGGLESTWSHWQGGAAAGDLAFVVSRAAAD